MRKIIYIAILIMLSIQTLGAENINILQFNYDAGKITLLSTKSTIGHYPDRILSQGTLLQIKDSQANTLYATQINPPLIEYTDIGTQENMDGAVIVRDNVNFSIAVPKFSNEDHILLLSPTNDAQKIPLIEVQTFSPKKASTWLIFMPIAMIIIFLAIIVARKLKKENP